MNVKTIHGGNRGELARRAKCDPAEITDFSVSINPLGPPDFLLPRLQLALDGITDYPEADATALRVALSACLSLPSNMILCTNGSNQLIHAIPSALGKYRAVIVAPAYGDYAEACANAGLEVVYVSAQEKNDFIPKIEDIVAVVQSGDLVFIGHPGNPSGTAMHPEALRNLAKQCRNALLIIDEAFVDFAPELSLLPEVPENIIVLRSLTKFYAIPGLRLGYGVAAPDLIRQIATKIPAWSINSLAITAGLAIAQADDAFALRSRELTKQLRERFTSQLQSLGITVFPGVANYLLIKVAPDAVNVADALLKKYHLAIRECADFVGLNEAYFRIGLKTQEENDRLVDAMGTILAGKAPAVITRTRRPALMLQGTCSDAGKSIIAAAFCRILLQDGYDVAPFKAQNMSLNSYVTPDGGEIGRAQAVQAEACRLDPDVRMNPVLLKPCSDTGSQVIVWGKPEANMKAREYFSAKIRFWEKVKNAYDTLAAEHEVMVLEGAGSPGEINLKAADIVNMNMARYAGSPVLLVGDIDRGGVYAAFLGMYATFARWERDLLKGFLVNKFRGDAALLEPAHEYVRNAVGKPVLGVIPFIRDLRLPAEDSMSFTLGAVPTVKRADRLDIALIVVGHTANFTDFAPLEAEPDIAMRQVHTADELGKPDVIILPGSKNTIADLLELRRNGLEEAIKKCHHQGTWIVGICGGLQMAGTTIDDPYEIESNCRSTSGMNLLRLHTTMAQEKRLRQTVGTWQPHGWTVRGYEIHHGVTTADDETCISMVDGENNVLGFIGHRVWVTYLHGIFDNDRLRRDFIDWLRQQRGLPPLREIQTVYDLEPELNRLADTVRRNVDMKSIYHIMGL